LTVKLSDFGVYKRVRFNESLLPETRQEDHGLQDTTYMAPETFEFDGKNTEIFTPAADFWSVGCIIYRLLAGVAPFRSPRDIITFTEMSTNLRDVLLQRGIESIGISFISQLLQRDPHDRLTATTALQHPWPQVSSDRLSGGLKDRLYDTLQDPGTRDVHYIRSSARHGSSPNDTTSRGVHTERPRSSGRFRKMIHNIIRVM